MFKFVDEPEEIFFFDFQSAALFQELLLKT